MIIELLSTGHLMSVAGGFIDSMKNASDDGLLQYPWLTQVVLLRAVNTEKKQGKGVIAYLATRDKKEGILVPSSCGCRILFFPLDSTHYFMGFARGFYASVFSNTVGHPKKIESCRQYVLDFEIAVSSFKKTLQEEGCVVKSSETLSE